MMTSIMAQGMAALYRDHVFRLHGLPSKIIHDRGVQFDARFMRELYKLLHIEANPSTAYHPQTDGQTERVNQDVELFLRMHVNHRQSDWSEWLSIAEFAYNNRQHSATKETPFFINTGRHPKGIEGVTSTSTDLAAEDFMSHMITTHEAAKANLQQAAEEMK